MGIVYRKEPSSMQEIIQISSQVIIAISAVVQMVLKLLEYCEHRKSNRPPKDNRLLFNMQSNLR